MLELELKIQDTQQQVVEIFGGRAVSLYGSFVARKPKTLATRGNIMEQCFRGYLCFYHIIFGFPLQVKGWLWFRKL